jgi:hypothetical protein
MLKKLSLLAAILVISAISVTSSAQSQIAQPTKTAPVAGIDVNWRNGLSPADIRLVDRIARNKSDNDRWMIWTAIVRNREASRDIYRGEPLTNDKVLANARVRMSLDESNRWTQTWARLNSWERQALTMVLRHDLEFKH